MSGSSIRYFPKKSFPGLSSSTLKIIAIVTMFIDHFTVVFEDVLDAHFPFLIMDNGLNVLRAVGRVAFPLFAFMIAEGAVRTHSRGRYLLRLGLFALVSEVPFDLALYGIAPRNLLTVEAFSHQNVFFTLFLGLLSIIVLDAFEKIRLAPLGFAFVLFAGFAAEAILATDYGAMGVFVIFFFYLLLKAPTGVRIAGVIVACLALTVMFSFTPEMQTVNYVSGRIGHRFVLNVSALYNSYEFCAIFASPLILLYNGEKGVKLNKFFFYGFYPGHLAALWGISLLVH